MISGVKLTVRPQSEIHPPLTWMRDAPPGALRPDSLSITNAVIAPAAMIRDYFLDEKAVAERKLMLNMGVMSVVASFFGSELAVATDSLSVVINVALGLAAGLTSSVLGSQQTNSMERSSLFYFLNLGYASPSQFQPQ
jgi:hypothetical protein